MKIVEIGCGGSPGPFFPNASEYFAVDVSPLRVENAVKQDPRMTPMVADAASMPELEDQSINVLLARNVLGDPFLGLERGRALDLSFREGIHFGDKEARREVTQRKLAIVAEASRLLVQGGKFVVVEQYTPHIAEAFIRDRDVSNADDGERISRFNKTSLANVTPGVYSTKHGMP